MVQTVTVCQQSVVSLPTFFHVFALTLSSPIFHAHVCLLPFAVSFLPTSIPAFPPSVCPVHALPSLFS